MAGSCLVLRWDDVYHTLEVKILLYNWTRNAKETTDDNRRYGQGTYHFCFSAFTHYLREGLCVRIFLCICIFANVFVICLPERLASSDDLSRFEGPLFGTNQLAGRWRKQTSWSLIGGTDIALMVASSHRDLCAQLLISGGGLQAKVFENDLFYIII